MKKFGVLISLFAFALISCTSKSGNQVDKDREKAATDQSIIDPYAAQESLDWTGIYEGTLPCADCEGIETEIELNKNYTYVATYTYIGKPDDEKTFSYKGTFTWDGLGSTITLESETETSQYRVAENELILLDAEGDVNVGEASQMYVLKKKM